MPQRIAENLREIYKRAERTFRPYIQLFPQFEARDDISVFFDIFGFDVIEKAAALADRFFPVAGDFYEGIAAQAVLPGAFFVICGHSHTQDGEALHAALGKDAAYVGMLGSRRKIAALFERLRSLGVPQAQLDTVCTPIGFDLGGETPEELAIAILAQILLVKNRGRQVLTDAKEDKA